MSRKVRKYLSSHISLTVPRSKLDPALSELCVHDVLSAALLAVMSLPGDGVTDKKEEVFTEVQQLDKLMKLTFNSLKLFVAELLLQNMNPDTLETVLDVRLLGTCVVVTHAI